MVESDGAGAKRCEAFPEALTLKAIHGGTAFRSQTDPGAVFEGYLAFGANYYWVPGTKRDEVKVLEYSDRLKIYQAGQCLAEYPLPADGIKNGQFSPPG
jgi:hypothetical protein